MLDELARDILIELEKGCSPWVQPWDSHIPVPIKTNGNMYEGINYLMLWIKSIKYGFNKPRWFTFNQIKEQQRIIKKGERGTQVVFFKNNNDDDDEKKYKHIIKYYTVFNECQLVDSLESDNNLDIISNNVADLQQFLSSLPDLNIDSSRDSAYYSIDLDKIFVPKSDKFKTKEAFTSTLFHELIHWTGSSSRLNRAGIGSSINSEAYAIEELIAEIGSVFLLNKFKLNYKLDNHVSYIDSWVQLIKNDKKIILTAAKQAEKAVKFLMNENLKK